MKKNLSDLSSEEFEAFMETPQFAVIAENAMLLETTLEDFMKKVGIYTEEEYRRQQIMSNERRISLGMPPLYPDVK